MADQTPKAVSVSPPNAFEGVNARKIRDFVRSKGKAGDPIQKIGIGFKLGQLNAAAQALFAKLDLVPEAVANAFQFLIEDMMGTIIARTPIDTSPDRDNIVASERWEMESEASRGMFKWTIVNTATGPDGYPYPVALEYGWSNQAPQGMIRITIEEYRQGLGTNLMAAAREAIKSGRVSARVQREADSAFKSLSHDLKGISKVMKQHARLVNANTKRSLAQLKKAFNAAQKSIRRDT